MIRTLVITSLVLALAAPAFTQTKPTGPTDAVTGKAFVDQLAKDNPNTFKCAHTGAACSWNFIKLVACKLNPEPSNGPWGVNGKRGNPNDLSMDALNFKGEGPGKDAANPANNPVTVIDVIVGAGGPTPTAGWNAFTDPVESSGAFVKPVCKGDVPTDNPGPVTPPVSTMPPYPGDPVFDQIGVVLFADYATAGQAPNPGMGRWFGRTVYDWLAGNTKTLEESIKKHRAEWCAILTTCTP